MLLNSTMENFNESFANSTSDGGDTKVELAPGDAAWTLVATAMVWLMVPGVGFLYCGMSRSQSALSLLTLCVWSTAVVSVQWVLFGYSLSFSSMGNEIIGHFDKSLLLNVLENHSEANPRIPEVLFCIYQGMFAAITPALIIGSTAERGRFLPTIIFMFLWTTFVYDFICYWTWGPNGWFYVWGGLDFAGGLPVHLASGVSAAVYAWLLEEREDSLKEAKPHNIVQVILGTSLIWFGYFGFNGASAMGANTRAAVVVCNTNISASMAGITWALLDYARDRKFSSLSFCFGAISGLVTVTPASGFIIPGFSLIFGSLGAIGCREAVKLKKLVSVDDALDVLAIHGVGGLIGTLLVGFFAQNHVTGLDGLSEIHGGLIDHPETRWMQIVIQAAGCGATILWSLFGTFAILFFMNKVPGLKLRVNASANRQGVDTLQMGESAYDYEKVSTNANGEHRPSTHSAQSGQSGNMMTLHVPCHPAAVGMANMNRRRSSIAAALHHIKMITVSE